MLRKLTIAHTRIFAVGQTIRRPVLLSTARRRDAREFLSGVCSRKQVREIPGLLSPTKLQVRAHAIDRVALHDAEGTCARLSLLSLGVWAVSLVSRRAVFMRRLCLFACYCAGALELRVAAQVRTTEKAPGRSRTRARARAPARPTARPTDRPTARGVPYGSHMGPYGFHMGPI